MAVFDLTDVCFEIEFISENFEFLNSQIHLNYTL